MALVLITPFLCILFVPTPSKSHSHPSVSVWLSDNNKNKCTPPTTSNSFSRCAVNGIFWPGFLGFSCFLDLALRKGSAFCYETVGKTNASLFQPGMELIIFWFVLRLMLLGFYLCFSILIVWVSLINFYWINFKLSFDILTYDPNFFPHEKPISST